ncbi:DUF4172 domain-containing protein [Aeromonas veronii]
MEPFWIWQQADWPHFRWQDSEVLPRLRHVQRRCIFRSKMNTYSGLK